MMARMVQESHRHRRSQQRQGTRAGCCYYCLSSISVASKFEMPPPLPLFALFLAFFAFLAAFSSGVRSSSLVRCLVLPLAPRISSSSAAVSTAHCPAPRSCPLTTPPLEGSLESVTPAKEVRCRPTQSRPTPLHMSRIWRFLPSSSTKMSEPSSRPSCCSLVVPLPPSSSPAPCTPRLTSAASGQWVAIR